MFEIKKAVFFSLDWADNNEKKKEIERNLKKEREKDKKDILT